MGWHFCQLPLVVLNPPKSGTDATVKVMRGARISGDDAGAVGESSVNVSSPIDTGGKAGGAGENGGKAGGAG